MNTVNLKKIKIQDPFWSKHVDLVRREIIPYQWDAMNDRVPDAEPSHSVDNFAIAAGLKEGKFYGAVFQDTDVAKWLEAVGFSLAAYPDEEQSNIHLSPNTLKLIADIGISVDFNILFLKEFYHGTYNK